MTVGGVRIEQVAANETYALRHRVLRPHQRVPPEMAGDAQPDSGSFAAFDPSGTVIGCVTVHREPPPDAIPHQGTGGSWRLRGMATADGHRRQGIGAALLTSAVAHVAARGGTLLWCNARMPAVPFYRKGGFETAGQPWEVPELGPHIVMWRGVPPLP